jgi:hypothetical protein
MDTDIGLAPIKDNPRANCAGVHWSQFSSEHPDEGRGVVQFVFADGAVHAVAKSIDVEAFILLSAIADGGKFRYPWEGK